MIITPNESSLGRLLKVDERSIKEWILTDTDTSYGVTGKNATIHFITGKNHTEKELDNLKLPLVLDGDTIVADIRPIVSGDGDELKDIIQPRADYRKYLVDIALVDMSLDSLDTFKSLYIRAMQIIIGGRLKVGLSLDVNDISILNNLIAIYALSRFSSRSVNDRIIIAMKDIVGEKLSNTVLEDIISDSECDTIDDVIDILKNYSGVSSRLQSIDKETLYTIVGTSVFGNHRLSMLIGLEVPAMFLSLIDLYTTNRVYNKTGMFSQLSYAKRFLDIKSFNKDIDNILKEYNMK